MFEIDIYNAVVGTMLALSVVVFIALQRIDAPYGMTYSRKWGWSVPNKIGWILMEWPVFFAMVLLWVLSPRRGEPALIVMACIFLLHYFQRCFIFPFILRGKNRMPLMIVAMGVVFNLVNAYMIGGWLFYVSPSGMYAPSWLYSPLFILGAVIFITGMIININSDSIIRGLRAPGDSKHYIPRGGMYRYVTGANYFGELTEWLGYAILTWSLGGLAFFLWTFANLGPRARAIHGRYIKEFGDEYKNLNRRYIIPFIY